MPSDYETRAAEFGLASPEAIQIALNRDETIVLDTRTPDEIAAAGRLQHTNWIHSAGCTFRMLITVNPKNSCGTRTLPLSLSFDEERVKQRSLEGHSILMFERNTRYCCLLP
jgi:hypothetical protein